MSSFIYQGLKVTPKRLLTPEEDDKGVELPLSSMGVSNYDSRPNDIHWDYDEFYKLAHEAGCGELDVFIVKGVEAVPGTNELFHLRYDKNEKPVEPKVKKYNHALDVAFQVISEESEQPKAEEIIAAMEKRVEYLKSNRDELIEACGVWDTFEVDEEE